MDWSLKLLDSIDYYFMDKKKEKETLKDDSNLFFCVAQKKYDHVIL